MPAFFRPRLHTVAPCLQGQSHALPLLKGLRAPARCTCRQWWHKGITCRRPKREKPSEGSALGSEIRRKRNPGAGVQAETQTAPRLCVKRENHGKNHRNRGESFCGWLPSPPAGRSIGGSVRGQRARVPASCADGRGAGPAQRLFCRVRASQRVEEFRRTRRVFGMAAPALCGDGSTYAHFSRGRRASRLVTFSLAGARSCLLQLS